MLTFKKLFFEDKQVKGALRNLVKEISPSFLEKSGDRLLFRGIKHNYGLSIGMYLVGGIPEECFVKPVRKDRIPRDMSAIVSKKLDDWFEKEFNFRARSEGLFTVGKSGLDGEFGTSCVVFPLGSFSYLWSPEIKDLWLYIQRNVYDHYDAKDWKHEVTDEEGKFDADKFDAHMKALNYKTTDLEEAIDSGNEIMLRCSSVLVLPILSEGMIERLESELGI